MEKWLINRCENASRQLTSSIMYDIIFFVVTQHALVAERQTQRTQNPSVATLCGFKSHLVHSEDDS